jgi:hypothetical protein
MIFIAIALSEVAHCDQSNSIGRDDNGRAAFDWPWKFTAILGSQIILYVCKDTFSLEDDLPGDSKRTAREICKSLEIILSFRLTGAQGGGERLNPTKAPDD